MTLAQYLEYRGLTEAEFAKRIGVRQNAVNRWKHGERMPNRKFVKAIQRETEGLVGPLDWYLEPAA